MTKFRTSTALSLAAAFGVLSLLPEDAAAQANCDWYGKVALKQQQENEKFKCGFSGAAWHSDLKAHLAWCGSVAPDVWKASAQSRDKELSVCATTKK